MGNQYTHNVKDPTNDSDAVNKKYCNEKLSKARSCMSGDIKMGNNDITGLPDPPLSDSHAVSKSYVYLLTTLSYWRYIYYMDVNNAMQHSIPHRVEKRKKKP